MGAVYADAPDLSNIIFKNLIKGLFSYKLYTQIGSTGKIDQNTGPKTSLKSTSSLKGDLYDGTNFQKNVTLREVYENKYKRLRESHFPF